MLLSVVKAKLSAITDPRFQPLAEEITSIVHGQPGWRNRAASLFHAFVSQIATEEGIEGGEDEPALLTGLVPNFVAAMIDDLREILLKGAARVAEPQEHPLLAAHLLLKLAEWSVSNYQWECLYGPLADSRIARLMEGLQYGLEVWGDRDEIWITLLDITEQVLPGTARSLEAPLVGCRGLWARLSIDPPGEVERWFRTDENAPTVDAAWMEMGVKTILTDQTVVRIHLKGQSGGGATESSGVLERRILALLGQKSGGPVG